MDINRTLRQIAAGNTQAFAEVVEHYQRPLFGFLSRLGLSPAVCEELAQETFLRCWSHLAEYDPKCGAFSTWLFTIARNLALSELTRSSRRCDISDDALADTVCDHPHPEMSLALEQQRDRLCMAMSQLSAADRCLIALVYMDGFKLSEIAAIEQSSTGVIKTRLFRARSRLYKLLEKADA